MPATSPAGDSLQPATDTRCARTAFADKVRSYARPHRSAPL